MSDLINYTSYPSDFTQSIIPIRGSIASRSDFLTQERNGIVAAMRSLEQRLTELEKDISRFERRIGRP